jgi:transposase
MVAAAARLRRVGPAGSIMTGYPGAGRAIRRNGPERRKLAATLRGRGWTIRDIASYLGVRYGTVQADLEMWQQENPGRPLPGTAARRRDRRTERVVHLRAEGLTLRQIAAQLGCHHQTVANYLAAWEAQHAGVTRLGRGSVGTVCVISKWVLPQNPHEGLTPPTLPAAPHRLSGRSQ